MTEKEAQPVWQFTELLLAFLLVPSAERDDDSAFRGGVGVGTGLSAVLRHLPRVVLGPLSAGQSPWFRRGERILPLLSCWRPFLANILWAVAYDYAICDGRRDDDIK